MQTFLSFRTLTPDWRFNKKSLSIGVLELRKSTEIGWPWKFYYEVIPNDKLNTWLRGWDDNSPANTPVRTRIAWIPWPVTDIDPYEPITKKTLDAETDAFWDLVDGFGLREMISYGLSKKIEGSVRLTSFDDSTSGVQKCCIFEPEMVLTWAKDLGTGRVSAICCTNAKRADDMILKIVPFSWRMVEHSSFLPFFVTTFRLDEIEDLLEEIHRQVSMVDDKWNVRSFGIEVSESESTSRDSWIQATGIVNLQTQRLAILKRRLADLTKTLDVEIATITAESSTTLNRAGQQLDWSPSNEPVLEGVHTLRCEIAILERSIAWVSEKLTLQSQTLFNLIGIRENMTGIELNEASMKLAKVSAEIAHKTQRDSTAMKALAAVAILFLPGTYVAAVFSMPFFSDQSGDTVSILPGFWKYWAITIPLTILIVGSLFLGYRLWSRKKVMNPKNDV